MIGLVWIFIVCFALDEVNANTAPCAAKWMEVHDVYSLGATFQFQIRSVDECKEACKKTLQGCVAIDMHGHFPHCFTHNQSLDNLEKSRKPQKGYTQLILIKECASSAPTPTTKIDDSTLQSFTQTDESKPQSSNETDESKPQSFPEAVESKPQSLPEAVESKPQSLPEAVESKPQSLPEAVESKPQSLPEAVESKPQSLPEAVESKPQSLPEAVESKPQSLPEAVESKPQSLPEAVESKPQSFTKTDEDIHENFSSDASVTSRSCIPLFDVKYPRFNSVGATPLLETKNEEDCKNACVTDMSCVSYQIDTNRKHALCWLQLDKANLVLDNMLHMKSVTEYVLVSRCSDSEANQLTVKHDLCFPVFENKNPGWVSLRAVNAPEAKTEDECKAACVSIPACVSYQIDRKSCGIHCWLQYNEQKLTKDQMYQSATITEYVIVDRCPKFPEPSSSTLAPTTGTDEISSTVSIGISDESISLPASENDCLGLFNDWDEYKDTYTPKGKLYYKVRDPEACKRACIEEIPGCVAVVHHVSGFCSYIDEDIDFGKNRMSRKGYVLYVRRAGCGNAKSVEQRNSGLHLHLDLLG